VHAVAAELHGPLPATARQPTYWLPLQGPLMPPLVLVPPLPPSSPVLHTTLSPGKGSPAAPPAQPTNALPTDAPPPPPPAMASTALPMEMALAEPPLPPHPDVAPPGPPWPTHASTVVAEALNVIVTAAPAPPTPIQPPPPPPPLSVAVTTWQPAGTANEYGALLGAVKTCVGGGLFVGDLVGVIVGVGVGETLGVGDADWHSGPRPTPAIPALAENPVYASS